MLVHLLRIFFNEMQVLAMTGKKTEHSRLFDKVVSRFLQRFKHVMVKHEIWDYERASYSYYLVACLADTLLGRTEELLPARRKTRFFRLAGNNSSVLPQTQATYLVELPSPSTLWEVFSLLYWTWLSNLLYILVLRYLRNIITKAAIRIATKEKEIVRIK